MKKLRAKLARMTNIPRPMMKRNKKKSKTGRTLMALTNIVVLVGRLWVQFTERV